MNRNQTKEMIVFWGIMLVVVGYLAMIYGYFTVATDPRFAGHPGLWAIAACIGVPAVVGGLWAFKLLFRVRSEK